jgi:hypothetical protein
MNASIPDWVRPGERVYYRPNNPHKYGRLPLLCRVVQVAPGRMRDVLLAHPSWREPEWAMHYKLARAEIKTQEAKA